LSGIEEQGLRLPDIKAIENEVEELSQLVADRELKLASFRDLPPVS
jgi:hypothetical protein